MNRGTWGVGYSSWGCKELETTERLTHSGHFLCSPLECQPVITSPPTLHWASPGQRQYLPWALLQTIPHHPSPPTPGLVHSDAQ